VLGQQEGHPACKKLSGRWHGYLSGVRCTFAYGPADATATHHLRTAPINPDWFTFLVLPFWYQLTQVVLNRIQKSRKMIVRVCIGGAYQGLGGG